MLRAGQVVYLLIPNVSNERTLHPGTVQVVDSECFVAEFDESLPLTASADVNAFAEVKGKFFQQGAQVVEVRQAIPKSIVSFSRCGEPVSAESRQAYRVTTVMEGIIALIGKSDLCQVVDVSPDGFGAVVKAEYAVGSVENVTLNFEGWMLSTTARVQTLKLRPDGKLRCGFLANEKKGNSRKTLEQIGASIQRKQLRRLSGAAA